ncbi:MAG: hypothetical protein HQL32_06920 [Planctomycetes bacterium]|nr:hypothetical protein [Planctomycetota bacterium]
MSPAKKKSESNRRVHLRYRDPETAMVKFYHKDKSGEKVEYLGLVVNESYSGMAVIYVGPKAIAENETVQWVETEQIHTPCTVVRCKELDMDVYSLALTFSS